MLEFLSELYERGLSYNTIAAAKCSISSLAKTPEGNNIGSDQDVVRFMKGIFELRPTLKSDKIWEVNKLLNYYRNKPANDSLNLKELTKKTCALLMLISAQRAQTLNLIRTTGIEFEENNCTIYVLDKLKQTRPNFHLEPIVVTKNDKDKQVCVFSCLKDYLQRTEKLRLGFTDKLFICYRAPHREASIDTICRWSKDVLSKAGIDNFTAKSYRSASSSDMMTKGVNLKTIMKTAGWSRESTFRKFYCKSVNVESDDQIVAKNKSKVQDSIIKYLKT